MPFGLIKAWNLPKNLSGCGGFMFKKICVFWGLEPVFYKKGWGLRE